MSPSGSRFDGFTLLELMMVVAIAGILATLAVSSYRVNIIKAETAQTLVDYGHIRKVVSLATQVDGATNLQQDSQPGVVPPALRGQLDARDFNGRDGTRLQLIRAPAGTFASHPNDDAYALVATADNAAGVRRLSVLRQLLPHSAGDKIWVQESRDATSAQLAWPLDAYSSGAGDGSAGGGTGGGDTGIGGGGSDGGNTGGGTGGGGDGTGGGGSGGGSTGGGNSGGGTGGGESGGNAGGGGSGGGNTGGGGGGTGPTNPGSGSSSVTGEGKSDGSNWTGTIEICIYGKDGKPLIGQNNTSVRYRVVTPYANFQEDLKIDPATGCVEKAYGGLPTGGALHVEVLQVVDYNPPDSGGTSTLWDGVKPQLDLKASP